jgi:hypothetical protein
MPSTRRGSLPAAAARSPAARSPSPRPQRRAKAASAVKAAKPAKPSAPRTPPVTDDDAALSPKGKGRESPSTTAVSAPSSTVGWHATVGVAPQARGSTALARFASVFAMLALIALTPHVAMLTCVARRDAHAAAARSAVARRGRRARAATHAPWRVAVQALPSRPLPLAVRPPARQRLR